jgi:hypothetical protein
MLLELQRPDSGSASVQFLDGRAFCIASTGFCGVDGRDRPTRASMQPEARSMAQP